MTDSWPRIPLGEVLKPVSRPESVDPEKTYKILGAHWYAKGLYIKGTLAGSEIRADRVYKIKTDDFVFNRLFAWKGSFAVAALEDDGCYVSNEFPCFAVNQDRADSIYLWKYFSRSSAWDEAFGLSSGGTPTSRNRLKEDKFLALNVPLPPLPEQRRIVARIEELAAKISEAQTLRQQAAAKADTFLGSFLAHVSRSSTWKTTMVRELVGQDSLRNGISVKPTGDIGEVRCLALSAMRNGCIDIHDNKVVPLTLAEAEPFLIRKGDVFVVRGNGSKNLCGMAGLVTEDADSVIFPDLFIHVPLPKQYLLPEFFVAAWNSAATREVIEEKAKTTSGIWKINQGHIGSTEIPIPSLTEQRRIVAELDALQAQVDALKKLQTETSAELDALLPSILDKAFKGEL